MKGDDPTEEQQQARGGCYESKTLAEAAMESCDAVGASALAWKSAYSDAVKTHLTPGEQMQCSVLNGQGLSYWATATADKLDALLYYGQAEDKRFSGDAAWATQFYAIARGHYEEAIDLFGTWTECNFQLAEGEYTYAAECWQSAKETVDDALGDSNCLFCQNPDAECNCLD